jgi:hypothetical protein
MQPKPNSRKKIALADFVVNGNLLDTTKTADKCRIAGKS